MNRTSNEDEETAARELIKNTYGDKVNTSLVENKALQTEAELLIRKTKIKGRSAECILVEGCHFLCKNFDHNRVPKENSIR